MKTNYFSVVNLLKFMIAISFLLNFTSSQANQITDLSIQSFNKTSFKIDQDQTVALIESNINGVNTWELVNFIGVKQIETTPMLFKKKNGENIIKRPGDGLALSNSELKYGDMWGGRYSDLAYLGSKGYMRTGASEMPNSPISVVAFVIPSFGKVTEVIVTPGHNTTNRASIKPLTFQKVSIEDIYLTCGSCRF